ncbi:aa3-type cytochrome c oxidase subunit IV [Sphingomonas sp. SUN019]|nr:aa3-type cytochrome c oxidase subunit IV [Sphingomonas sp. SUN019]UVO50325.1 aa3-type cytochrome c oxidase subunit IV [Sphingomonas sp. SUN019]
MADETVKRDDMKAHLSTYASIMNLLKWGTLGCAIVAAIVIWLIA